MDWDFIMNTAIATIIASLIALAGVFITHWLDNNNGYKRLNSKIGDLGNKTLAGLIDDKIGKLDNQSLAGLFMQKIGKLDDQSLAGLIGKLDNTTLSGQNIDILHAVQDLKGTMDSAKEKDELKRAQLTGDQAQLIQSVEALSAFAHVMTDLQDKCYSLTNENQQLKQRIAQLQEQTENLQQEPKENSSQSGPQQTM